MDQCSGKMANLFFLHAIRKAAVEGIQGRGLTVKGLIYSLLAAGCCRASLLQMLSCQCNGSLGMLQHSV